MLENLGGVMKRHYNNTTLNEALVWANSSILDDRKRGAKILRQASCLELGTKNTIPVRIWFISHTEELMQVISSEQDSKLLWDYIYMLKSFCGRYIHLSHLVKNSEGFKNDERTIRFEKMAISLVNDLSFCTDMRVMQAVGSFFWLYKNNRAWDIFIKVLPKKKDRLTLAHITNAISELHHIVLIKQENYKYLISEQQIQELVNCLLIIGPKSSMPIECLICVDKLNEVRKINIP